MRRVRNFLPTGIVLFVLAEPSQAQVFVGAQYDAATFARSIAAADLDGDGDVDIATAGVQASGIGFCRNNGHGGFLTPKVLAPGGMPHAVAAGDLDGNGIADLVAVREEPAILLVLLADGNGDFVVSTKPPVNSPLVDVMLADLDADGALDVIACGTHGQSGIVDVWRGDGLGGLAPAFQTFASQSKCEGVTVLDSNGDGFLDVACASQASYVTFFAGDGHGNLAGGVKVSSGLKIPVIAAGDVNGDGRDDLLATDRAFGELRVLLASPGGGFVYQVPFPVGAFPFGIATGDWNEDGALDAAVTNENSYDLSRLLGTGGGALLPEVRFNSGVNPAAIVAAELDGDGHLDLVIGNSGTQLITPLLGDGKGGFDEAPRYAAGQEAWAVDLGDVDEDGRLDAITTNALLDRFTSTRGDGVGGFLSPSHFVCHNNPMGVTIADINGDGHLDVVTANVNDALSTGSISIRRGNGTGAFASAQFTATGSGARAVEVADLSGDGRSDVITANFNGKSASVLIQTPNGGFTRVDHQVGFSPRAVAIGDLNGDGVFDFAEPHNGPPAVAVFLGSGGGAFPAPSHHLVQEYPTDVEIADVDGDGAPDILVSDDSPGDIAVLLGDSAGAFAAAHFYTTGNVYPESFELADVDADGWLDVVSVGGISEAMLLLGDGKGHFGTPLRFAVATGAVAVAVGDLNDDGRVDAVATSVGTGSISVLLNRSTSGVGCAGSGGFVPTLEADGYVQAGDSTHLVLKSALGGSVALFVFGFQAASIDVASNCSLLVAPPFAATVVLPLAGHGAGTGSATLELAVRDGVVTPISVFAQAFVKDAGAAAGYSATNSVQVTTQ